MLTGEIITRTFDAKELLMRDLSKELEEEPFDFTDCPVTDQAGFMGMRLRTAGAAQKLVATIFDQYVPETKIEAVEFGSGAWGCFYNLLLPKRLKKRWKQYEINPKFVENNQQFSKKTFRDRRAVVEVGDFYNMPFKDSTIDLIVGLSSWDGCAMPHKTTSEIKRCLRGGGYFIHFQDIAPGESPLYHESRKRFNLGLEPKFPVTEHVVRGACGYERTLLALEAVGQEGQMQRASFYLTEVLASSLREAGLDIKYCDSLTAEVEQKRKEYLKMYYRLGGRTNLNHNRFEMAPCQEDLSCYDPSIKDGQVRLRCSMDVVVAQKQLNQ